MSYSSSSCISHKTPNSNMWGISSSPHVPTFLGLCHKCWTSNTVVYLTESYETLCNKCFGEYSRMLKHTGKTKRWIRH
ncbi:MAG: hypothetical protein ACE5RP_06515 [Nitrosopumilus sp.]